MFYKFIFYFLIGVVINTIWFIDLQFILLFFVCGTLLVDVVLTLLVVSSSLCLLSGTLVKFEIGRTVVTPVQGMLCVLKICK